MFINWSSFWAIWHAVSFPLEEPVYPKNRIYNLDMEVDIAATMKVSEPKTKGRNRTSPDRYSDEKKKC